MASIGCSSSLACVFRGSTSGRQNHTHGRFDAAGRYRLRTSAVHIHGAPHVRREDGLPHPFERRGRAHPERFRRSNAEQASANAGPSNSVAPGGASPSPSGRHGAVRASLLLGWLGAGLLWRVDRFSDARITHVNSMSNRCMRRLALGRSGLDMDIGGNI